MSVHEPVAPTAPGPRVRSAGLPAVARPARPPIVARPRAASRPRTSLRGAAAVTGVLAFGALLALAAAHTASLLPESIRLSIPKSLSGILGGAGLDLHVVGTMAVLGLLFVSYAAVVAVADELSPRVVIGAVVAIFALVLVAPPLFSTDVFSYQAYARMGAEYGINPYLNGPHTILYDGVYPYIGEKWTSIHSVYGPVFTAFSYLLAPLSIAASVLAYKAIAAASGLALVAVVARCARLRGIDPRRAVALVGLNPLLVLYGVGGGHNDMVMLLAVAGSVYALVAGRRRTGGGLAMLAIGVKLTGGLLLPFAAAAEGPGASPRRRNLWLGALGALVPIAALSAALFGSGALHVLAAVGESQTEGDWKSIPGAISQRLHMSVVGHVCGYALAAVCVAVCVWLLRRVWQQRMDWIDGAGWATLAILVAASSLLPWYVAWLLPFAALGRDRRLSQVSIAMTGIVLVIQLLGYIPHGVPLL